MSMSKDRFVKIRAKAATLREAEAGAKADALNAEPNDELTTFDSVDALITVALEENPD
jgi:hypothetical protein